MEKVLTVAPEQLLLFDLDTIEALPPTPSSRPSPADASCPTRTKYQKRLSRAMNARLAGLTKRHLAGDGTFRPTVSAALEKLANQLLGVRRGRKVEGLRTCAPAKEAPLSEFLDALDLGSDPSMAPGSEGHLALLDLGASLDVLTEVLAEIE